MSASDLVLLEQWAKRRDAKAFHELVSRHAGMVYGTCRRILGNSAEAEDVAQECFLKLAQARFRIRTSLPGWLHALATHRSLDRLRADRRRTARERRYAESLQDGEARISPAFMAEVDRAIAELPEGLRVPIVLHFLEEQTQDAVAERIGLSRSAVSRRLDKGIELIRKSLGRRGVPMGIAALAAGLGGLAEAAPASVTSALGRMALAGGAGTAVTAGGIGAATALKGTMAAAGIVLVVGVLGSRAAVSPPTIPAPITAAAMVTETSDAARDGGVVQKAREGAAVKVEGGTGAETGVLTRAWDALPIFVSPGETISDLRAETAFQAAELLFKAQRYETAKSLYEKTTVDYPHWQGVGGAWMMVGICWGCMENYQEKAKALEEAVRHYPSGKDLGEAAYFYLAGAYGETGRQELALQTLERCVELCRQGRGLDTFPGEDALNQLWFREGQRLYVKGRYAEALPLFDRLVAEHPGEAEWEDLGLLWAGYCKEGLGRTAEARRDWEEVVARYPRGGYASAAYYSLGRLYREDNDAAKAAAALRAALRFRGERSDREEFPGPQARRELRSLGE